MNEDRTQEEERGHCPVSLLKQQQPHDDDYEYRCDENEIDKHKSNISMYKRSLQQPLSMKSMKGPSDDTKMVTSHDHHANSISDDDHDQHDCLLPKPLRMLFTLNGATEALPSLAYTAIVNDRIAIQPAYLPAYYAIAFLPYSLKPFFGMASAWIVSNKSTSLYKCNTNVSLQPQEHHHHHQERTQKNKCSWVPQCIQQLQYLEIQRHTLLTALLIGSSAMIFFTAFLQSNHAVACFCIAFARGFFISWAEFMLGVSLIQTATLNQSQYYNESINGKGEERKNTMGDSCLTTTLEEDSDEIEDDHDGKPQGEGKDKSTENDTTSNERFREKLLSVYQSQAALSRNLGSLMSSIFLFVLFGYRHYKSTHMCNGDNNVDDDNGQSSHTALEPLSDEIVTAMLVIASLLPLVGSFIANRHQIGTNNTSYQKLQSSTSINEEEVEEHIDATIAIDDFKDHPHCNVIDHPHTPCNQQSQIPKYDIAALFVFQAMLVFIGLRTPIISIASKTAWTVLFVILLLILGAFISCSYSHSKWSASMGNSRNNTYEQATSTELDSSSSFISPKTAPNPSHGLKRVALYLILRHSVPSAGILLSSYFYMIFRTQPLLLQVQSIMGSLTAALSTWFYQHQLAKRYSGIRGITIIIIITTLLSSACSLLDIPIIHLVQSTNDKDGGGGGDNDESDSFSLKTWVVIVIMCVHFMNAFVGEISFLPSVILATTSSVKSSDSTRQKSSIAEEEEEQDDEDNVLENDLTVLSSDEEEENSYTTTKTNEQQSSGKWIFDEGTQYGLLISCIDFGDQLSDWLSIPLIEVLGVHRDNGGWDHLDWLVVVCAVLGVLSLLFLRIVR